MRSTDRVISLISRHLLIGALCALASAGASAQSKKVGFDHPLTARAGEGQAAREYLAFPETVRVLVAMVEFLPDNEPRTTGNGRFDLTQPTRLMIDPPPHNAAYARQHMTFLDNYFRKSSDGKQFAVATVLDSVFRLPQPMAYYSPPRSSPNNAELGKLVTDAWHLVDSLNPGFPFQSYDAFLIFHAGVGRDIDLASQLGYDPAPYDIPSVYMSIATLRKIYGPAYAGVPVSGGSFLITNSLIIPETENRTINTGGGTFFLELGINGLIVASVASHLGLPDLFNTSTGRSGIGRFGLMDGQSIFSWGGVFPPEPSAWEKYFLGWISPVTASAGTSTFTLPAATLATGPDSVLRIPISGKEYFLVENRNRDAQRDSAKVTLVRNGVTVQKAFARDTVFFNAYNQDSLYGVVTDVDEFDWSLPGHTNTRTNEWFDGGLLIWHIDENVIDAGLLTNTVNANPNRRGVNLMEADGSQDIGLSYDLVSPGFGSEDGTNLDYWYHGNASTPRAFLNEFTPNSFPNSLSNDFANSHVYVRDFSDRGPRMTLTVQLGDAQIRPLPGFPRNLLSSPGDASVLPADLDGDGIPEFVVMTTGKSQKQDSVPLTDGAILAFRQNGTSYLNASDSSGAFIAEPTMSFDPPIVLDFDRDGKDDIVTVRHPTAPNYTGANLRIYSPNDANGDGARDVLWGTRYAIASTAPLRPFTISAGDSAIVWGGTGRHLLPLSDTTQVYSGSTEFSAFAWEGSGDRFSGFDFVNGIERFGRSPAPIGQFQLPGDLSGAPAVADLDRDGTPEIIALQQNGTLNVLDTSGNAFRNFPYATGVACASSPAVGNVEGDGSKEIFWTAGNKLYAVNIAGAMIDNFPIALRTNFALSCSPVLGYLDGDGSLDVAVVTQEGLLYAFNTSGHVLPGFPLQLGGNVTTSVTLFKTASGKLGVAAASEDHFLYAWELETVYDNNMGHPWPMYLHDPRHSGFQIFGGWIGQVAPEFLPASRTYNWPNPVTSADGFRTHIRYFVANDARVTIRIFDMAGDLVSTLEANAIGGLDNEIVWDASGVQSGVYFGNIDAQGTGGSGHAIIKIAVVR